MNNNLHEAVNEQYNRNELRNPKKTRKKSLLKRFIMTVSIILGIFLVIFTTVFFGFSYFFGENPVSSYISKLIDSNLEHNNSPLDIFSGLPERTNIAVLGVDEDGTRTDVMMLCSLNSKTSELDIISVPRDTYAVVPQDRVKIIQDKGMYCPSGGEMKLNAVHHYAGKELGVEFIVKQLEEILDTEIQYYVKIDLDAFVELVDEVGGIEFDVPQRMYYNDPIQDLFIDLQPGLQKLNGKQAEGLIRYRKADANNPLSKSYAQGDIQRVQIQQDFLKAMITQMLSKNNIVKNAPALFTTAVKYVKTNFSAADLTKYAKVISKISPDKMHSHTIPHTIGDIGKVNYVIVDKAKTSEMMKEITMSDRSEKESDEPSATLRDVEQLRIEVLNGGSVSGIATRTGDMLSEKGYNVTALGNYDGERVPETRIYVRDKSYSNEFKKLFSGASVTVDKSMDTSYDVIIILGTSAK